MNRWFVLVSVLTILLSVGVVASYIKSMPVGQVVAALASVTVAAVGLFVFFHRSNPSVKRKEIL